MDLERRFKDRFHDEGELPSPMPLRGGIESSPRKYGIKRQKFFSEKLFKAAGGTLKIHGKNTLNTLKLRNKFTFFEKPYNREEPLSAEKKLYSEFSPYSSTNCLKLQNDDDIVFPQLSVSPLSRSVECLPISQNNDSYLPQSIQSSIISLPKFKTLKVSNKNKFGTFKRNDGHISPYGSILKSRLNRIKLESKHFEPQMTSSPLSYTLPVSPFLDSSISFTDAFKIENTSDSKANFYGQENYEDSHVRTDYSCRISQVYGKNIKDNLTALKCLEKDDHSKYCKEVRIPQISKESQRNDSDSFSSRDSTKAMESDKTSTLKLEKVDANQPCKESIPELEKDNYLTIGDNFQSELLSLLELKFSSTTMHSNGIHSENESIPNSFNTEEIRPNYSATLPSLEVNFKAKPKISPKPNLLAKQQNSYKPDVPLKPERLKLNDANFINSIKVHPNKFTTEVNNNCIIMSKPNYSNTYSNCKNKNCETESIKMSNKSEISPTCFHHSAIKPSKNNKFVNKVTLKNQNNSEYETESQVSGSSLKVKDLVASFNQVQILSNEAKTSNNCNISRNYSIKNRSNRFLNTQKLIEQSLASKKSLSEWNLKESNEGSPDRNKCLSFSESLNISNEVKNIFHN